MWHTFSRHVRQWLCWHAWSAAWQPHPQHREVARICVRCGKRTWRVKLDG